MNKDKILEKISKLKTQQEQAKELYIKCEGAIEILQSLIEEEDEKKKK